MYVDANNRRSGLARELICKAIERAKEMNLEQLTLGVVSTNEPAKICMNQWALKHMELKKEL